MGITHKSKLAFAIGSNRPEDNNLFDVSINIQLAVAFQMFY
jgi:hypothetical protein